MSNTATLWCCLAAVIISIIVSYKWNINMGILSMSFAFIIGCLFLGNKANTIIGYWPDTLVFFLIVSCLFFGFARENGTLKAFGAKLLWAFRKNTILLPWVIMFAATIMGLLGAANSTVFFLAPIAFELCLVVGFNPVLMVFAVNAGYAAGNNNPWTGHGNIFLNLIEANNPENSSSEFLRTWCMFLFTQIVIMAVIYVWYVFIKKENIVKGEALQKVITKPDPFTPLQKKTFILIITFFVIMVIPNCIDTLFVVKSKIFSNIVKFCTPQAMLPIFALIAIIMKLADPKKVMMSIPINTILLIAGICFLMEIAVAADLINVFANFFTSSNLPTWLIAPVLTLLAGFLSIFSSSSGVVWPLLIPLAPALSAATGASPVLYYTCIMVGAQATSVSPFSSSGCNFLALAPNEEMREKNVLGQLKLAVVAAIVAAILAASGIFGIL